MSFIFGSAIGMLAFGFLCDRFGYKKTMVFTTIASIVLLYAFLFSPLPPGYFAIALLGLLGTSLYLLNPLIIAWGNSLVPQSPSTVSALLMGLAWCFSNLIPALAGLIAKMTTTAPYITSLSIISLFLFPSLACVLLIRQTEEFSLKKP